MIYRVAIAIIVLLLVSCQAGETLEPCDFDKIQRDYFYALGELLPDFNGGGPLSDDIVRLKRIQSELEGMDCKDSIPEKAEAYQRSIGFLIQSLGYQQDGEEIKAGDAYLRSIDILKNY